MSKSIHVGTSPKINIDSVGGDLSIIGWDGEDMLVKADDDEVRFEQKDGEVFLSTGNDLSLRIPKGALLLLKTVGGDTSIRGVMGDLEVKEVGGDLSIREAGLIAIDSVRGDFSLRGAKKNLYIKNAQGDVSIRDVEGSITLDSVADDLALRGARGNIKVNVGEDVVVYLEPRLDGEYSITAGDDILLVLPPNTNATLTMHGDDIDVDWPGIKDEDVTERVVTLGNGSAKIYLNAGGDVRVSNNVEAGESAEEFGNFAGLNFDWSGFGERISRRVEQATARAAKRVEEAARRAERHAGRHARHGRHGTSVGPWNWDFGPKGVPNPPTPPSEPVSEDERMAILKMLAEKKITAEQAEQLLAALEGNK
ncbi:MAG: DUF4097 domain-containing protein [Anaerolineae bacterium]|nr:DUF4097 domain-containing protein [Anaerolineae bacterium]MCI0607743.1 DUF4097 domain-containing protein [Anaerolineae bacterium]